jgi:anti-anti-sigma factor
VTSGAEDAKLSEPVETEPTLRVTPLPDGSGYALTGMLDLSTAATARDRLDAAWRPGATVNLDLSGLEFMDSTGLNLICGGLLTLGEQGSLVLRNARGIVRRILTVSGIEERPNVRLEEGDRQRGTASRSSARTRSGTSVPSARA